MEDILNIDELKDVFGITSNETGSNKGSSDIYDDISSESNVDFNEKLDEFIDRRIKKVDSNSVVALIEPKQEDERAETNKNIEPKVEEPKKEETVMEEPKKEETVMEESISEEPKEMKLSVLSLDEWRLDSPSEKFNVFYQEKANVLSTVLIGNQKIDSDRFENDLKDAVVDVSIAIYDINAIHEKMQEVQGWRDRVKEIQIVVNRHYYRFETALNLLRGLLARVEYAKPAAKQEGLIYEHLGDMEFYFSALKNIHRSAEIVSKNLDNAYETLSRQLTIALPQKTIDTYVNRVNDNQPMIKTGKTEEVLEVTKAKEEDHNKKEVPNELLSFDELSCSETAKDDKKSDKVHREFTLEDLENAAKPIDWNDLN